MRTRSAGIVAALALLGWYVATMAPGPMWFDAGELALNASQRGLGHPPGQPLYTLLLIACSWVSGWALPSLPEAWVMNGVSALAAAACALAADSLLRRVTDLDGPRRLLVLLTCGALAPVWDQATRIELYAPATAILLALLAGAAAIIDEGRRDRLAWLGLGGLVGLLASVNPVFAAMGAGAVGLAAAPTLWRQGGARALLGCAAAACAGTTLGLAPYAYLLAVREPTAPILVWGDLSTLSGVWAYLRGADYAHTEHAALRQIGTHLGTWLGWMAAQGGLVAVTAGLLGWLLSPQLRARWPLLATPLVAGLLFTMTYGRYWPEVPDFNGYLMPALWLGTLGLGSLLARLRPGPAGLAGLAVLAITLTTGERPIWRRDRSALEMPAELARAWLLAAPPRALLVLEADHLVFPVMYLQAQERLRPDVTVINVGWTASRWYWDYLARLDPSLPPIPLAARSRVDRLRRLFKASGRPVLLGSIDLAVVMRLRPCPHTWGVLVGAGCALADDDPAAFEAAMAGWWSSPAGRDLISPGVLAQLGRTRAAAFWALGQGTPALRALRAGVAPREAATLPIPEDLQAPRRGQQLPRLGAPPIGSGRENRAIGSELLRRAGDLQAAARWAPES